MKNELHIGLSHIEFPRTPFLYINDEVPIIPKARIFDPKYSSFNPLERIDYKTARELAETLYSIYPQGQETLTRRNGKRALTKALLSAKRFHKITGDEEVQGMIDDVLLSPVLRRILCGTTHQFSFNPRSIILARINRQELGDFDALILGLLLISTYKGQIIIPDLGFYGRDAHTSLVRENRLIAKVRYLDEIPSHLRRSLMSIPSKIASFVLYEDALTLARYAALIPGTNAHSDFVSHVMS